MESALSSGQVPSLVVGPWVDEVDVEDVVETEELVELVEGGEELDEVTTGGLQALDWRASAATASEGHLERMHMVAELTKPLLESQMHLVSQAPEHFASVIACLRQVRPHSDRALSSGQVPSVGVGPLVDEVLVGGPEADVLVGGADVVESQVSGGSAKHICEEICTTAIDSSSVQVSDRH